MVASFLKKSKRVLPITLKKLYLLQEMEFEEFEPQFKSAKIRQNPV